MASRGGPRSGRNGMMSANSIAPERHHLARQVQSFKMHAKKLKKIFKETVKVLSDLQDFDENLSIDKILAVQAQKCISNVVSGRTALVVFGDNKLKMSIANEVLGEAVLPAPKSNSEVWRMIHFKYKRNRVISYVVDGYDVTQPSSKMSQDFLFSRIPRENVCVDKSTPDPAFGSATLEVGLNNPILESGFEIICAPSASDNSLHDIKKTLQVCQVELHPFFVYGHDGKNPLTDRQMAELEMLRRQMHDVPLLFSIISQDLMSARRHPPSNDPLTGPQHGTVSIIYDQLCKIGYLNDMNDSNSHPQASSISPHDNPDNNTDPFFNFVPVDTVVTNFLDFTQELLGFVQCNMKQQITSAASSLHDAHARCLQTLILYAHDLARDNLVTPKRIKYARSKEEELYTQLIELASRKQSEIKELVHQAITEVAESIIQEVLEMNFEEMDLSDSASGQKTAKACQEQIQEVVFRELSRHISEKLVNSVNYLRESVIGTLQRCLERLEGGGSAGAGESFGETGDDIADLSMSFDGGGETTRALSQILDTAYNLEFNERTSTSAVRLLMERLRQVLQGNSLKSQKFDKEWRTKYVRTLISGLSATRLSKSICAQFRAKVTASHETFLTAIKQLEMRHSGRLKETLEQRNTIRKILTPKMARLSLSSVALRDGIVHGLPITGRELGRGQYGVVFQCAEWAGKGPLAVKSVVPPDEKHWNDLALEFHYTWTLPKNDRVVNLVGALIDDDYSNGSNAVVLFIMHRFPRDLHAALKVGLDFGTRMQIAADVIDGIRFLHSQGLLHRDIKLKNVLLDNSNRGCLTDLGFCKPEAMMTCTIVGTPIHMAPELFGGNYDNSVDIYAFGILFWYICANDTKLPGAFDACQNKEQLWTAVRKGLRPERLPRFDTDCWELMTACWHGDPLQRPLVGDITMRLHLIMKRIGRKPLK